MDFFEIEFSESDRKLISAAQKRVDAEYFNLWDLSHFPPFGTPAGDYSEKRAYKDELILAHMEIIGKGEMSLLMGEYELFTSFKNKFEKLIKEAKSYRKKSNNDINKAQNLFHEETKTPFELISSMEREYPW